MVATDDGTKKAYNVYIGYENMPSIDDTKASYGISYICNKNYPTQIDVVYLMFSSWPVSPLLTPML